MNLKNRIENLENYLSKKTENNNFIYKQHIDELDKLIDALTESERKELFDLMDKYSEKKPETKIKDMMTPGDFKKFSKLLKLGYSRLKIK